ncbi:MAG TPA: lysophospholipid acyltransferase family protein [Candidatus Aquilonibacter sp.]|nr:lysophospholipid acyltransferase family protein [Candidatus Aquilonibacter sp.]
MILLRKLWRLVKVVCVFAAQLIKLAVIRPHTRPERAAWMAGFCRAVLRAANISRSTHGPVPMQGAVISNHLSYLDIVIHGAERPCVFVSAIETRRMPVIGWISMMAGTVYVTRGQGGSAEKAAEGMAKGFRDGLPVVFFPEGGTFTGDEPVMAFHSGLLAQALEADAPVTAGFLRYELSAEDRARGKTPRQDVSWSTQTLLAHIWNLLGLRAIRAELRFAEGPIEFSPTAYEDRKVAAAEAREAVLAVSRLALKDGGTQFAGT